MTDKQSQPDKHMDELFIKQILDVVKERRNLDFSQYRMKLLTRRIMVRLRATKRDSFEEYHAYLSHHPAEMDLLLDALTINVTEFFRDEKVFETIENRVIPDLLAKKKKEGSTTIRVWSCASSTGMEAYSLLMLLAERLGDRLPDHNVQICGTDIDENALMTAMKGVYDKTDLEKLPEKRKKLVDKYFYDIGNDKYWIREEWVGFVNFQFHDVIADTPLENIDLILCRNLLMYFDRKLQDQVIETFWRSLNEGGFLILGNVESIMGATKSKFLEYDRASRIYLKG